MQSVFENNRVNFLSVQLFVAMLVFVIGFPYAAAWANDARPTESMIASVLVIFICLMGNAELESEVNHAVTEIRIGRRTCSAQVRTGKEVAKTTLHLDVFGPGIGRYQVEFLTGTPGRADCPDVLSVRRPCPENRVAIRAIPKVVSVREPEGVAIELELEFF